jgi:hypothetical protein
MTDFNPLWFTSTSDPNIFDFRIDNSGVQDFTTCARAAEFSTVKKRETAGEKSALFYGTTAHSALEVRKKAQLSGDLNSDWPEQQLSLIETTYLSNPQPLDEWRSPDLLIQLIQKYNKQYPIHDEPFSIIPGSIELPFAIPLGTAEIGCDLPTRVGPRFVEKLNIIWTGRIDAIVNFDNSIFIMDHKTSSIGGPSYFEDFRLTSQMHGYVWAAWQLGHPACGLLLDSLISRKPSATGKGFELRRERYWYDDEAIEEWKQDTFTHITDFLEHAMRNYFPKATKWCHGKYGECPYWHVCTTPKSDREALLFNDGLFKDVTWSPLNDRI